MGKQRFRVYSLPIWLETIETEDEFTPSYNEEIPHGLALGSNELTIRERFVPLLEAILPANADIIMRNRRGCCGDCCFDAGFGELCSDSQLEGPFHDVVCSSQEVSQIINSFLLGQGIKRIPLPNLGDFTVIGIAHLATEELLKLLYRAK